MQIPLQITLRGLAHSPALEEAIRAKAAKLEHFFDRIVSCRVVVELDARHKRRGRLYSARIDLKVPGEEIVVTREPNEDLQVALRDAFDAAKRRLEDHARQAAAR